MVALAGTKLDLIRQRIQHQTLGRRGHTGDPLYGIRRIARTRIHLLSVRQYQRLTSVLDADEHIAVKVAWSIYQKIIAAYADPNRRRGKRILAAVIDSIRRGVPAPLGAVFVGVFGGAAVCSLPSCLGVCLPYKSIKTTSRRERLQCDDKYVFLIPGAFWVSTR